MVIASADLFTPILHFCRNSKSTAEIKVPACPIPTHQTELVISQAQPMVLFRPQVPIPVDIRYTIHPSPQMKAIRAMVNMAHQDLFAFPNIGAAMSSVTSW